MIRIGPAKNDIMQEATSRQFNGGLDVTDSELNLTSRYAVALSNMVPGIDGSLSIKQGSRLFADIAVVSNYNAVNCYYYAGNIIVVNTVGQVFAVNGQGVVARIWDSVIAAEKRAGLETWGATNYVVFLEFGGNLILANGSDKPLTITAGLLVDYLADLATGSNINVPVSRIIQKFNRHVIFAIGATIYVSERDAAGTWPEDAGVIYTGIFDLSSYVTIGDPVIVAMLPYKGFLLVYFRECIVPVQFNEIVATDTIDASLAIAVAPESVISNHGTVAPRTLLDAGDESLALDIVGVSNITMSKLSKILQPDRPSRLVDPLLQKRLAHLANDSLHDYAFSVYDTKLGMYMLMIPNEDAPYQRKSRGFGYRHIENQRLEAWTTYEGWNWQGGCRSSEGRIFFIRSNSTKIFVLGDEVSDPINADYMGEQETFSDGTVFKDGMGFSPIGSLAKSGVPINWHWEIPWTDLKKRGRVKTLRYMAFDTTGDQQFMVYVFIDDKDKVADGGEPFSDGTLFTDDTGFAREFPLRTPALSLQYIGKDAGGYGVQPYGSSPYGSGNNTGIRNLTLAPTKFNTMKLRMEGSSMGPLKFSAITLLYQGGSIRRMQL